MHLYVPNIQLAIEIAQRGVDNNPNDAACQRMLDAAKTGTHANGCEVRQIAQDFSNVKTDGYIAVAIVIPHALGTFPYPDDFFDKFHLVTTLNDELERTDIFCDITQDPEEVYARVTGRITAVTGKAPTKSFEK